MSIEIVHQAQIPLSEVEKLRSALKPLDDQILVVEAPEEGPQNAIEWALPVGVALVCSAPLVKLMEGFFSAAGEDAYKAVKAAISRTFSRAKSRSLTWTRPGGMQSRPPPLSIRFQLSYGEIVFVFPDGLDEVDAVAATENLNVLLGRLTETLAWHERQAELLRDHHVQLFGPGFPISEQQLHRIRVAHQLALGTWVFVPAAGEWVKVT